MTILDALRSKQGGDQLATLLESTVRRNAEVMLRRIGSLFPQYTDHTIEHSNNVVRILDWLVPAAAKQNLNKWELYFLVAAAYLHDLGMLEACPGSPSGPEWQTFRTTRLSKLGVMGAASTDQEKEILKEYVRDHHHERSELYIRGNGTLLGLTSSGTTHEADIVGRISLGHRKVDLGSDALFSDQPFGDVLIRRRLLAAYLRLADELDTTAFRTPLAEAESTTITDSLSELEWQKHLAISGIAPERNVIVVGGHCDDPVVYERLLKLHREIQQKLEDIRQAIPITYVSRDGTILNNPIPYERIALNIDLRGFKSIDTQFTLDESAITHLLGSLLYGDEFACLRELLQNSVDTCYEAQESRPASWKPTISVTESLNQTEITVSDNGMGMNESII